MRRPEATTQSRSLRPLNNEPSEDFVASFLTSMPLHYRGYDPPTVRSHALTAFERGQSSIRAKIFRRLNERGVALCIVAADRPGLLSLIAAALALHELDVIAAQIYTRELPDGRAEAVDLFWVRRRPLTRSRRDITSEEIESVESLLIDLTRGDRFAESLVARAKVEVPYSAPGLTWVRFEEDQDDKAVLVVQTLDRPGLLLAITRCLFCLDIQIVRSEVDTTHGTAVDRFYLLGFDGRPIAQDRRTHVESEVMAAVESQRRGSI
jgi:UTP:GlnB (protein PII) uridylyltransferase